jgi:DNA-binding protein HU-beta
MTKTELAAQLAEATDRSKQEAEQTLDLVFAGIATALQNGEKLELRGFGTFKIRDQKARVGRNPQTGEAVNIPAKKVAVFKPSKQLAEQVKG